MAQFFRTLAATVFFMLGKWNMFLTNPFRPDSDHHCDISTYVNTGSSMQVPQI